MKTYLIARLPLRVNILPKSLVQKKGTIGFGSPPVMETAAFSPKIIQNGQGRIFDNFIKKDGFVCEMAANNAGLSPSAICW